MSKAGLGSERHWTDSPALGFWIVQVDWQSVPIRPSYRTEQCAVGTRATVMYIYAFGFAALFRG